MKETTIFVLYAHNEHESYAGSTEIIGVFKTKEQAQEIMSDCLEAKRAEWIEEDNHKDEDIEIKKSSDFASIYDTLGGIEYTEYEIVECEVQG